MKKIRYTTLLFLLLSLTAPLSARNDLSDLRGLSLTNAKIPIYNRGGKPQMMIFVNRAERQGRLLTGTGTVLEFIRPNASVDDIGDAWKIKPYPLKASYKTVFDFWFPRFKYSEAVVITPQADIDQESHKASGSAPIYLRSPLLDLNGIGFEADFKRREIRVNSEIEVLLRTAGHDPRKLNPLKAKDYQYITASGDSLLIELEERRIMLIGSVVIKESQATITCDRLTIALTRGADRKKRKKKEKFVLNTSSEISGISKLLADGSVIITDSNKNSGKIYADHLVYDLHGGQITLTNDEYGKVLTKEQIRRQAIALNKKAPDQIGGYVVIDSPQMRSYGKNVIVNLRKSGKNVLPTAGVLAGGMTGEKAKNQAGALQNILYPNGVLLCGKQAKNSKEKPFVVSADYGEFLPENNAVNLKNHVTASDGTTQMTCDTATLKLKGSTGKPALGINSGLEAILCRKNVQLLHKDASGKSGTLLSDKADFYPNANKIVFYENVRGNHEKSSLACQKLELFLADRRGTAPAKSKSAAPQGLQAAAASAKTLQRAVASGNVVMTDPHAVLKTGILTMFFRELAPGEKPEAGMLQAGGVRLAKVVCDKGINVISDNQVNADTGRDFFGKTGSKGRKTLLANRSETDLLKNISTFRGKVRIFDELSKLECDTMNLYGAVIDPKTVQKKQKASQEDPDADPYQLKATENHAPSRIALTGNMELDKVECLENVKLHRLVEGKWLTAGSARADYKVSSRKIVLSGREPERAWIQMDGQKQISDQLIYHLQDEKFESKGNTITTIK